MSPRNNTPPISVEDFTKSTLSKFGIKSQEPVSPTKVDPIRWIENNFYLYDTMQQIHIYPVQERLIREALRRDDDGNYVYNTVIWSWPKKSAKSTIVAAICHYIAFNFPNASIKLVANDLKQADSRVGYYLRESIKLHPKHRDIIKIKPTGFLIQYPNGSRIEMVPIDPRGEAGGNDDLIVYSELWGWKSQAHQQMWAEMTLSPTKYGKSQRWVDTYAGYKGDSPILEYLYSQAVDKGERVFNDLEAYTNRKGKIFAVWVTQHLLPWQRGAAGEAYYAEQASTLTPAEYDRMHHNQWISSTSQFVAMAWWDSCHIKNYGGTLPPMYQDQEIVLGADAGVSSDCFALMGVTRSKGITEVRICLVWVPPKGGSILFSNPEDPLDETTPEGMIRILCARYNVVKLAYDQYQLHEMITRLKWDNVVDTEKFDQGQRRYVSDKHLYDIIRGRRLRHSGEPELREHVQNSQAENIGEKMRIVKKNPQDKIDLTVALAMASEEAHRLNLGNWDEDGIMMR